MLNKKIWIDGEVRAAEFLKKKGYKIIDKNCKIGGSEIDIVAVLPVKVQKNELIEEFRYKVKHKKFSDKYEQKFSKTVLKNNLKTLKDIIVFIEVKARFSKKFGYPFEAVDEKKQYNLERGCVSYLKKNNLTDVPARIDVISVIDADIVHIENAFEIKIY